MVTSSANPKFGHHIMPTPFFGEKEEVIMKGSRNSQSWLNDPFQVTFLWH